MNVERLCSTSSKQNLLALIGLSFSILSLKQAKYMPYLQHRSPLLYYTPPTARCDSVHFGDCHVGRLYHKTFTMTNHSNSVALRFQWPQGEPHLHFSPQIGHLHAECTKEVTVSFSSEQPIVLNAQVMKCKLYQITFQQPVDQVPDWDDRHRTVKWVDVEKPLSPQRPAKKKVRG